MLSGKFLRKQIQKQMNKSRVDHIEKLSHNVYKITFNTDDCRFKRPGQFAMIEYEGIVRPFPVWDYDSRRFSVVFRNDREEGKNFLKAACGTEMGTVTGLGNGFDVDAVPDGAFIVADSAGVATTVREMKDDRIVKESFLDSEGKRTNNRLGVGAVLYSYDFQGRLEKVLYQDTEGNPARCSEGYAGYMDKKDEDGATISRILLGTDGQAAEVSAGYSEIRYFYNEYKQLSSTRYYDLNGQQVQVQ